MFKTKYYLKTKQGIILGVVKVNEEENVLNWNKVVDLLNSLTEENEQLRQKKHWVYVDVDNANGCMNCKYNISNICSILDCGTHDYLVGVSECGLKYWESLI